MSEENLRPTYDDQVNEDVYKRGAQSKLTKARKADFDDEKDKKKG